MAGKKTKQELNDFLNRVILQITSNLDIDEILLFGSYARGEENDCSDIDIAVISPEFDPNRSMYFNAMKVFNKTNLIEPYLQLVPLSSDTFYHVNYFDNGFIKSIKETGKSIYKKSANLN